MTEDDPFEEFARSLQSSDEAREAIDEQPVSTPSKVSDAESLKGFVDAYVECKDRMTARRAADRIAVAGHEKYLQSVLSVVPDAHSTFVIPGNKHDLLVERLRRPIWDQKKLREIDASEDELPEFLKVRYTPRDGEEGRAELKPALKGERENFCFTPVVAGSVPSAFSLTLEADGSPILNDGGTAGVGTTSREPSE